MWSTRMSIGKKCRCKNICRAFAQRRKGRRKDAEGFAPLRLCAKLIFALVFMAAPVCAQNDDNPYLLKRGDNEFGFSAGFSPKATTIFGGLHDDEAEDRRFFIAALRYGRTLAATNSLALQYILDSVPVAIATGT